MKKNPYTAMKAAREKEGPKETKVDKRQYNRIPKGPAKRISGWDSDKWENSSADGISS